VRLGHTGVPEHPRHGKARFLAVCMRACVWCTTTMKRAAFVPFKGENMEADMVTARDDEQRDLWGSPWARGSRLPLQR